MSKMSSLSPRRTNSAAHPVHSCLFQYIVILDGCKKQAEFSLKGMVSWAGKRNGPGGNGKQQTKEQSRGCLSKAT